MPRQVHHYERIHRQYPDVCRLVEGDPVALFPPVHAGTGAPLRGRHIARLSAHLAGHTVVRTITIELRGVTRNGASTTVSLRWWSTEHPELFPVLDGVLELAPLAGGDTRIGLLGSYRPPLRVLGSLADAVAGHRIAEDSARRFVHDVAQQVEHHLSNECGPTSAIPGYVSGAVPDDRGDPHGQ